MADTDVLMTWDSLSPTWFSWPQRPEAVAWLGNHGIDTTMIYRVEFLPGLVARVYRYATNAEGRRYQEAGAAAVVAPEEVALAEMPPPGLEQPSA